LRLSDVLGVAPFLIFAVLFLIVPTLFLVVGAFLDRSGAFTLGNIANLNNPQIISPSGFRSGFRSPPPPSVRPRASSLRLPSSAGGCPGAYARRC
jgi:hypothetical protein